VVWVTLAIAAHLAGGCVAEVRTNAESCSRPAHALVLPARGYVATAGDERCRRDECLGVHRDRDSVPLTRVDVRTVDRRRTSGGRVHEDSSTTTRIRSTSGF
jgi:hypothetical protein